MIQRQIIPLRLFSVGLYTYSLQFVTVIISLLIAFTAVVLFYQISGQFNAFQQFRRPTTYKVTNLNNLQREYDADSYTILSNLLATFNNGSSFDVHFNANQRHAENCKNVKLLAALEGKTDAPPPGRAYDASNLNHATDHNVAFDLDPHKQKMTYEKLDYVWKEMRYFFCR